jgi:hypothetical protein
MVRDSKRPAIATVFGVLNIIFGEYGVIGLFNIKNTFYFSGTFFGIISIVSGLVLLLLFVAGIFLIMNKSRALSLNRYYAYASLTITLVGVVYLFYKFGFTGMMGNIVAIVIGVIYPPVILFVLLRNREVQAFYSGLE